MAGLSERCWLHLGSKSRIGCRMVFGWPSRRCMHGRRFRFAERACTSAAGSFSHGLQTVDIQWTCSGHAVDMQWTYSGHTVDSVTTQEFARLKCKYYILIRLLPRQPLDFVCFFNVHCMSIVCPLYVLCKAEQDARGQLSTRSKTSTVSIAEECSVWMPLSVP